MSNINQQDVWSKIFVIERDLLENQRSINKLDSSYVDLLNKLESLKDEIRKQKSIDDFEERIKDLEDMVDSLRQEMPEMRLIRKIVFALVAFILTAFLGVMWNTVILSSSEKSSMKNQNTQELAKKIIEEYNKGEKPNGNK